MPDPIKVLGLIPGCSMEEAQHAYHELSVQYHPDKNPDTEEKYREISEAWSTLKANPSLLDDYQDDDGELPGHIIVTVPIEIQDVYLSREIPIRIDRKVFCRVCRGTGSKYGLKGVCKHCGGLGKMDSPILDMLQQSHQCPFCKGTGVKKGEECSSCLGAKIVREVKNLKLKLDIQIFNRGVIRIQCGGNQSKTGLKGDLIIKLDCKNHDTVRVDSDSFIVNVPTTPAERMGGGNRKLSLFGREIAYKAEPGALNAFAEDVLPHGVRRVRIEFKERIPALTPATELLYRQIIDLEKE
jgi:DnaJ-class molecular chaperone